MSDPIRVLVVDDSALMRTMLCRRIGSDPRFTVMDVASNGLEGVEKAIKLKPDVVTLDIEMPVLNGIEALKQIVARTKIPVIMISSLTKDGAQVTLDALSLGAVDFVGKANGGEMIHEKLFAAAQGGQAKRQIRERAAVVSGPERTPYPRIARRMLPCRPKVVVIGSSTGGPQALQTVLGDLPQSFPIPILIAQHMPKVFTNVFAQRLNSVCAIEVVEANDGDALRRGVAYIAQGGLHMRLQNGKINICSGTEGLYFPSVDILATSAGEAFRGDIVGVMLTGLGNDGTKGFLDMRNAGAYILAQDQESCAVYGMPRAIIEADGVDEILPLSAIGSRLRDIALHGA